MVKVEVELKKEQTMLRENKVEVDIKNATGTLLFSGEIDITDEMVGKNKAEILALLKTQITNRYWSWDKRTDAKIKKRQIQKKLLEDVLDSPKTVDVGVSAPPE